MDNYTIYPKQFRTAKIPVERNRCFMLMPFDKIFDLIYGTIKSELQDNGYICNRADEIHGSYPIMNKILTEILKSQYIIADLTNLNPNVFYELGIAHTFKDAQNILLIKQKQFKCPFDITHLTYIEYDASNLKLLTSIILQFIKGNNSLLSFQESLHLRGIINIIHDNKEMFVDYLLEHFKNELSIITDILNYDTKDLVGFDIEKTFNLFNSQILLLIQNGEYSILNGILKVYYELIISAPFPIITDKIVYSFLNDFFQACIVDEKDILSWQADLSLKLASHQQKLNIVMPWIISYFKRTKSTTIDLNRYKLERFLMLTSDKEINQIIADAVFDDNCYVREHLSDIIGEKKLYLAEPCLIKQLEIEENYFTATSIIEAIGKLNSKYGIDAINTWLTVHNKDIIETKQFFILKHIRIAIMKLDNTANQCKLKEFDQKYASFLSDYYIL